MPVKLFSVYQKQYLKESCIKIGQGNIQQVILHHVNDGWNRYFKKVNGLLQNILQNNEAQDS